MPDTPPRSVVAQVAGNALSDDAFEARLRDTSLIETHEEALTIIDELDREIANIQVQVASYMVEAESGTPSEARQAWFRRATYASAMRRNERHKVIQRDKELRGMKRVAQMPPKKDPAVRLAKHERLQVEAQDRLLKRQLAAAQEARLKQEAMERQSIARIFMAIAKERLPEAQFTEWKEAAKARREAAMAAGGTDA